MWTIFLTAIALVLVIEGITPFLAPKHWRQMVLKFTQYNDRTLRIIGLVIMLLGVLLMYLVHAGLFS